MKSNGFLQDSWLARIVFFGLLSVVVYASINSLFNTRRVYEEPQFTVGVVLPPVRTGKGKAFNYAYWVDDKRYSRENFPISEILLCSPKIGRMQHEIEGDTFLVAYAKGEPWNATILMINSQYEELNVEPLSSSKELVDKISECEWWR